jgi:nucleoside-diphosphate-sugar epimerase
MDNIKGCAAVVTGGASGIGQAISLALAREGARVVVADLDEKGMAETVGAITKAGGEAIAVRTDVSSLAEVQALAERARGSFGPISIVCNNAGVSLVGSLEKATFRDWQWVMGVNLWGVVFRKIEEELDPLRQILFHSISAHGFIGTPFDTLLWVHRFCETEDLQILLVLEPSKGTNNLYRRNVRKFLIHNQ